jgi:hypothetical protein
MVPDQAIIPAGANIVDGSRIEVDLLGRALGWRSAI